MKINKLKKEVLYYIGSKMKYCGLQRFAVLFQEILIERQIVTKKILEYVGSKMKFFILLHPTLFFNINAHRCTVAMYAYR